MALTNADGRDAETVLASIDHEIRAARASGRRVFVVVLQPANDLDRTTAAGTHPALETITGQRMWSTTQLDSNGQQALDRLFTHLPAQPVWQRSGERIFEIVS
jgi:hypothetical protein